MKNNFSVYAKISGVFLILFLSQTCLGQYQSKTGNTFGQSANPYSNACATSVTGIAWSNPLYARTSDALFATASIIPNGGGQSEYLLATNFGFSIPGGATITGIQVCVQGYASPTAGGININNVKIIKANVITGTSQNTPQALSTTDTWYSFGSCTNLFGTALTPGDVNSSGFGVAISVSAGCCPLCFVSLSTTYINAITLIVHYNNDCTPITCSSVLPITLTNFEANPSMGNVNLKWATATETNNKTFTVEKSLNGTGWGNVITLPGAGTSSIIHHYSTTDYSPYPGISYYRLKQTDYDGTSTYSGIAAVTMNETDGLALYPNPATDKIYCSIPANKGSPVALRIIDVTGRTIFNTMATVPENGQIELPLSTIKKGVYILEMYDNYGTVLRKNFIKQ